MILKWKNCIDQLDNINLLKIHKTVKNQIMMTVSEIIIYGGHRLRRAPFTL